jgi:prevent-host-death family protein
MTEMPLMDARAKLTGLSRELRKSPRTVVKITHRGKPSMALMSAELYDTLVDTLDAMANPETDEALRESLSDIRAGRVHTVDEVAKRLGLER